MAAGIQVRCQDARDLVTNRALARRWLAEKLEHHTHGADSKIGRRVTKIRKQKQKQRARQRAKAESSVDGVTQDSEYDMSEPESGEESEGSDHDDEQQSQQNPMAMKPPD